MRILIDAVTNGSGGYIAHLNGILSAGAVPEDVRVLMVCSRALACHLRNLDDKVEVLTHPRLTSSLCSQQVWRWLRLHRLVNAYRPDILFTPQGLPVPWYPLPVPYVTMCHNVHAFVGEEVRRYGFSKMGLKMRLLKRAQTHTFKRAAGVVFPSAFAEEQVRAQVAVSRCRAIAHGVDTSFFAEHRLERDWEPADSIRVLYVSSVWLYKNQWHVVEAVERLRESTGRHIRLDLVGGGEPIALARLRRSIAGVQCAEWVRYHQPVPSTRMPALYRRAHIFVFASSCESFGIPLLEAMASGLPIACADRRPMSDMLQDGGVYFEAENPASIAHAVRRLLDEPETRLTCARRAHAYAQEYTWARCARDTFGFLNEVWRESVQGLR